MYNKFVNMSTKNDFVFKALYIMAWIIFVGLCIEAGGLLVNFFFSVFNPSVVKNLYQKLDLSAMYSRSKWAFYGVYSFILVIAVLKAFLFYILIRLLGRLDLSKPFNYYVSRQIAQISYYTFFIGILSLIAIQVAKNLMHFGYDVTALNEFWADGRTFILMAAVIYVIAAIFNRGLEIQNENDLTV